MTSPQLCFSTCSLMLLCIGQLQAELLHRAKVVTEFIILHNNDMHARFEQTNRWGGTCSKEHVMANKCFGGMARVGHVVREYRQKAKGGGTPVFFLNAGDTYQGTAWFTIFKDNITSAFLNMLQPDVMCLGNHEFDDNVAGLIPHLKALTFPVLACNLNMVKEPQLKAFNKIENSTVLTVQGTKIGVIGYVTPDTKFMTQKNNVEFLEEIVSINAEAQRLKAQGINIIIALGHSGYEKDQEIARDCPEVDIVIGGHSHTYLDANQPVADKDDPNPEAVRGPYPTNVKQPSGKIVPVVQAFAYTKYLGKLHVQFDMYGNLIGFKGAPLLLHSGVEQDQELLNLLEVYRPNITQLENTIVGYTKVHLDGGTCRMQECNLGNIIADSMVHARVLEHKSGDYWTDAPIALIQGGGIRSSIAKNQNGSIRGTDLFTVLPFDNMLYITEISGKTLRAALEHSASVRGAGSDGGFLQYSGVKVKYDFKKEAGDRVASAEVRCAECDVPTFSSLSEDALYKVVVSEFMLNGGDGHVLKEKTDAYTEPLAKNDLFAFRQFLEARHYLYTGIDDRISSVNSVGKDAAAAIMASISLILLSALIRRLFWWYIEWELIL